MSGKSKIRLDQIMTNRYGYESRSRARDAVLRGCVSLNGKILTRPSHALPEDVTLEIRDEASRYVSRAALKLHHAVNHAGLNLAGLVALDLGASTGGFTQVLLENDVARVFAIDVGHGQLHPSLRQDERVEVLENLNIRDLEADHLDGQVPDLLVCDLSFISLKTALPAALSLAGWGATGVFLIKPQFEVGRDRIGSGGIVRDEELLQQTVEELCDWMNDQPGWQVRQTMPSPITGGDGNREFLMIAVKEANH